MDEPRHLIRTQAIQIGMARPESAQTVMDLAGSLWRTRLADTTDEIFSACCAPREHLRLDRLELALGTIPEEDFAREFPVRFRARLEEELRRQLRRVRAGEGGGRRLEPAGRSPLELLEHLLLHGTLPWWARQNTDFDPARALVAALTRAPREVAALVRRIGRHRRVRSRLVHWLEDREIARLIRAVAPAEAEFILRYAEDLDTRQDEKQFVPAGAAEFRQAKWEVILGHLLADRGSRFNAKAFLRQTLQELAGRFRLEYAGLLTELARVAAESQLVWRESSLPLLLGELFQEDVKGPGEGPVGTWMAVWSAALRERPGSRPPSGRAGLAFWRELSAGDARALIRQLVARHGSQALMNFLADGFSTEEHAELSRLLAMPIPGETAEERREIGWLAEALAQISLLREKSAEPAATPAEDIGEEFAVAALRVLLETGALPPSPWAHRWRDRPGAWLNLTLARQAEAVPPLLRAWTRSGRLTTALAAYWPDAALESIVETVEPAQAEAVIAIVHATVRARPAAAGRSSDATAWRNLTWQIVFDYLLADRGSVFNTRSFLAHNLRELAVRHQVDIGLVWESLVAVAEAESDGRHGLLNDLRAIAPAGSAAAPETAPEAAPPTRAFFSAQSLRRSALVRLRLLQLVLAGAPVTREPWLQELLPLLWELLAAQDEAQEPWRELLRQTPGDAGATSLILQTGGTIILAELFFAREPAQAALWRDAVLWLENSSAAAALFPGGRTGLGHRLWRILAELWREAGGGPIRDAAAFLVRALLRLGLRGPANTGLTPAQAVLEILRTALAQAGTREAAELAGRLLARLPVSREPDAPRWKDDRKEEQPKNANEKENEGEAEKEAENAKENAKENANENANEDEAEKANEKEDENEADDANEKGDENENEKGDEDEDEADDDKFAPIEVSNAGLVLLLPFFPELFKRCGWLDGGVLRDFDATQRAVHLLQYLVNDGRRTHEYSLVLNKVLCGLEPEAAVVARVKLADAETAAARQLLEYVTSHWARGATISVDGLRNSYLHRPGWLKRTPEGWSLRVERRGWDVLLPDLPWRFPGPRPAWMSRPLEVDWI